MPKKREKMKERNITDPDIDTDLVDFIAWSEKEAVYLIRVDDDIYNTYLV